jgi:hypothetical protein
MRRAGRIRPDALHRWGGRWRRAGPVGPVRTRVNKSGRTSSDAADARERNEATTMCHVGAAPHQS